MTSRLLAIARHRVVRLSFLMLVVTTVSAQEPPWDPAHVRPCDRACLVDLADRYVDAIVKKNPAGLPIEPETRITENTATVAIGEGCSGKPASNRSRFAFTSPIRCGGRSACRRC